MRNRVTGIMRVKNEGPFIRNCIESCINALDELVVVYNDCTDNSADEIEKMVRKYPDKIRSYEYPYEVRAENLSKQEFEEIKASSEDNPHLLSTYANFALSKVRTEYAVKIDADQVYFTTKLKEWCDFMRDCAPMRMTPNVLAGRLFQYYISAYRFLSLKVGRVLPMMPLWLLKMAYPAYIGYAKYAFSHDEACMSLSGINVLETDKTLISMGHPSDECIMLVPFNGVGDTVMFKMSDKVCFRKYIVNEYNQGDRFCVAEEFVHPYKRLTYIGYFWKHNKTMHSGRKEAAIRAYEKDKDAFLTIDQFKKLSYRKILQNSPDSIFFPFQKILFGFIYNANKDDLFKSLEEETLGGAIENNKH